LQERQRIEWNGVSTGSMQRPDPDDPHDLHDGRLWWGWRHAVVRRRTPVHGRCMRSHRRVFEHAGDRLVSDRRRLLPGESIHERQRMQEVQPCGQFDDVDTSERWRSLRWRRVLLRRLLRVRPRLYRPGMWRQRVRRVLWVVRRWTVQRAVLDSSTNLLREHLRRSGHDLVQRWIGLHERFLLAIHRVSAHVGGRHLSDRWRLLRRWQLGHIQPLPCVFGLDAPGPVVDARRGRPLRKRRSDLPGWFLRLSQ